MIGCGAERQPPSVRPAPFPLPLMHRFPNSDFHNIFREGELEREVVCAKFAHTTHHGIMNGESSPPS